MSKSVFYLIFLFLPLVVLGQYPGTSLKEIGGESNSLDKRRQEKGFLAYMNRDFDKAYNILVNETNSGNHEVLYALGKMYENGRGVTRNEYRAFSRFEQAAKSGNVEAQYLAGLYLFKGQGVTKNLDRSIDLLSKAAENNHPLAGEVLSQVRYDKRMADGKAEPEKEPEPKSKPKVRATWENVAEGDQLFEKKEYAGALDYYLLAAEKGNAHAQERVGWIYYNGKGKVDKNKDQAISWWKKAANQGNADAINYLTRLGEL